MSRPALTSQYLQQFLATAETLPYDLQRNFTLMRELDARTQEALRTIEQLLPSVTTKQQSPDEVVTTIRSIHDNFLKCLEFGDDKIQIAAQSYEMVDKHIQRLDGDVDRVQAEAVDASNSETDSRKKRRTIKDSENDLLRGADRGELSKSRFRSGAANQANRPGSSAASSSTTSRAKDVRASSSAPAAPVASASNSRSGSSSGGGSSSSGNKNRGSMRSATDLDMPVDPNEPVYCTCHQVSYGEMIGCDNPDCTTEWFHFQCVGLQSKPKGKWFCPKCTELKKKGLIK